ncbi:MAG: hypothetical protein HFI29_00355 [Lachnospiraceae bacterium]|jgi:beta-lactamase regulating signal transducer with metallopeptidase domain|nr:hypothetical protein [Lachnospiraceae bacterium]
MLTNLFLSVLEISLSVSLIVAVLLIFSPLLNRRYASKWNYWIWIFLALRLVIPFHLIQGQSVTALFQRKSPSTFGSKETSPDIAPDETILSPITVELPPQLTAPILPRTAKDDIPITLLDIAALLWLAGCLGFLSVHLMSYLHYKKWLLKKGLALKDKKIWEQLLELEQELQVDMIDLIESPRASSPMMIGFRMPVLVLPKEKYTSKELYFILKHELIHLKRRDVYKKLLFVVANGVHWFNPLIWMMQRNAVIDMELSCDEIVIQGGDYTLRKAYTETLFSTLHRHCTRKTPLSTQFYGGKDIMKKRFLNILNKKGKKNGAGLFLCAIAFTFIFGTLIGCTVTKEASNDTDDTANPPKTEELPVDKEEENTVTEPAGTLDSDSRPAAEIPQSGQIYGYISEFNNDSVSLDRKLWITMESEDWKPEYDEDAGFEVVDAESDDITYPIHKDCTYAALENHQGPVAELGRAEFESYLQDMEFPILWIIELEDGQIKRISEQYRP